MNRSPISREKSFDRLLSTLIDAGSETTRLYKQLEDYARTLEMKVAEKDRELQQEIQERIAVETALRLSEEKWQAAMGDSNRQRQETALQLIVEGTAAKTGDEFFHSLVRYLAEVLGVRYALVTEYSDRAKNRVRTLAYWQGETWSENFDYDIDGTPCGETLSGLLCYFSDNIQALFPEDKELVEADIKSYLAMPLIDARGNILGHLAVMDTKPMGDDPGRELILRIFAARAGAELERKMAEAALRKSELKFRCLFENSQVGIILSRIEDGLILDANQRLIELIGYSSPAEAIGKRYTTEFYVNPSDRQQILQELRQNGAIDNHEVQFYRRDRTTFWGLLSLRLNLEENLIEAVVTDISDRKRAEEALRNSEARFRALYEYNSQAILVGDENEIIDCNNAVLELFQCDREEIIGKHPSELSPPFQPNGRDSASLGRELVALAFERGNYNFEWVHLRPNGTQFSVEVSLAGIVVNSRHFFQGIMQDLTQRKQVEAALAEKANLAAFRASVDSALAKNDSLRSILNRCAAAMVKYLNAAFARIWTYNAEENLLELQASAGIYTRLNGQYSRVRTGKFSQETIDRPHITNAVFEDDHVLDKDWARREGLVALASYPIRLEEQFLGMLTMFAKSEVPESTLQELEFAAGEIALGIKRKRAEEALKASEARLNTILNGALAAIIHYRVYSNREWEMEYCSAGSKEIWGYSPEELIADKNFFISHMLPGDLERNFQQSLTAILDESTWENEYRYNHPDGEIRWISVKLSSVRDEVADCWIATTISTDISDRKRAEAALQESELKFRTIVENANDLIFIHNLEGIFTYYSPNITPTLGYDVTEIEGHSILEFVHPEDLETSMRAQQTSAAGEKQSGIELRVRHKNGSWRWLSCSFSTVDSLSDSVSILGISHDITKRKQAEQALQRRARVESLLSNISRQFIDQDADTAINFTLEAIAQFIGIERICISEYSDDQTLSSITHEWSATGIEPLSGAVRGASVSIFPWFHKQILSGQTIKVSKLAELPPEAVAEREIFSHQSGQSILAVPTLHSGKVVGCLAGDTISFSKIWTQEDINLLKLVGELIAIGLSRHKAEVALQHRAQIDSLLSHISRQFIDRDAEAAINFTLEALAQFLGVERMCIFEYSDDQKYYSLVQEWCATGIPPIPFAPNDRSVELLPWLHNQMLSNQVLKVNNLADMPFDAEVDRKLLQHTSIQSALAVPICHSGKVVGLISANLLSFSKNWSQEDINLLKLVGELIAIGRARYKAEAALKIAKDAAEAANRAKSTFLANMSHELRTPLNAILGFSQVMLRDRSLNSEQQEYLAIVNRSGEHLLALINDVLDMSKIEAGRTTLNSSSFDLHFLLDSLKEMLQLRAKSKGLQLIFDRAVDLPRYIIADESKLRQVLINLLGNAIKFTQAGCVILRVKLKPEEKITNHRLFFEVEDTGPGINPAELEILFEAFVQAETGRNSQQGTGLGLAISRQFVRLMGGDLTVSSNLGQGSTFKFELPVTLAKTSQVRAPKPPARRVIGLEPNQKIPRILVVEDVKENRQLLIKLLTSVGFEVGEASNGEEAIALVSSFEPHLIWMDMRMPVMDGYEATKQIKATLKGQSTVIIALTASAFEENRTTVLAAGCDDFVRKPFAEEVIFEKMATYLEVRYLYEEVIDSEKSNSFPDSEDKNGEFDPALLQEMPGEWVAQLDRSARSVNGKQILQLLKQIPESKAPLAKALAHLVNNFRFDLIVELIQKQNEG